MKKFRRFFAITRNSDIYQQRRWTRANDHVILGHRVQRRSRFRVVVSNNRLADASPHRLR